MSVQNSDKNRSDIEEKFMVELNEVYEISSSLNSNLSLFYSCFDEKLKEFSSDKSNKMRRFIDEFLDLIEFEKTSQNRLSVIRRLVLLKEDFLISSIEEQKLDVITKKEILSAAYSWAASYHVNMFEELIYEMEDRELLTPFYRELIKGVKSLGLSYTQLDVSWDSTINEINSILLSKFNNSVADCVSFVHSNNLMDKLPDGSIGDRSYSILVEDENAECGFSTQSYGEYFEVEVDEICSKYHDLVLVLGEISDDVFGMRDNWISYFESFIVAFSERNCDNLISVWRDVDYAWMNIKCPIQTGHCLEYYNDNIRNCVEIEWDLRFVNPVRNDASSVMNAAVSMYEDYMSIDDLAKNNKDVYDVSKAGLSAIQLYVGMPVMYFAKFFNGMFSAQVVPNDEIVSKDCGKKIFAFADFVLANQKTAPSMKLSHKVFGDDFLKEIKNICDDEDVWHKVYSISTIGHEVGHILWKGTDSEVRMNGSGNFKNIEEYKATSGGLVSFFKSDEVEIYWREVFYDVVERAVKLIAWKKNKAVLAYYCEGMTHLTGLFECGVLSFNGEELSIDMSRFKFDKFSSWTISNYEKLFSVYLSKVDATEFLKEFAKLESDGYYMPVCEDVKEFVVWYYELYEKIGREVL